MCMKRVSFFLLFAAFVFLLGCDDSTSKKKTGFRISATDIASLDREIDRVVVELSYKITSPTGFDSFKTIQIASSGISKKGFTVYLPETISDNFLYEGIENFHTGSNDLTISNPNIKITRSISFNGYARGQFKGLFICDNYTSSQPLAEKGYKEIGIAYSNAATTITGTESNEIAAGEELRSSFDLDMDAGYNFYMSSTIDRNSTLHHLSYSAPVSPGEGGTKWRFLRTSE